MDYLPTILTITKESIENKDVDVGVPAMEIWSVLGIEIKDRMTQAVTV